MRLTELDASFVARTQTGTRPVDTLAEADGITFQCPGCAAKDGKTGGKHAHYIICWFRGRVPNHAQPAGRWSVSGLTLDDCTFVPGTPPVPTEVASPCGWRGQVQGGAVA